MKTISQFESLLFYSTKKSLFYRTTLYENNSKKDKFIKILSNPIRFSSPNLSEKNLTAKTPRKSDYNSQNLTTKALLANKAVETTFQFTANILLRKGLDKFTTKTRLPQAPPPPPPKPSYASHLASHGTEHLVGKIGSNVADLVIDGVLGGIRGLWSEKTSYPNITREISNNTSGHGSSNPAEDPRPVIQENLWNEIKKGNETGVKRLLEAKHSVNTLSNGVAPLHLAAYHNRSAIIPLLIAEDADINIKSSIEDKLKTPLHWAVTFNRLDALKTLLELGADPTITTSEGETAKDLALSHNHQDLLPILDEAEQKIKAFNTVQQGDLRKLRELIRNNTNLLSSIDSQHNTLPHIAALHGQDDITKWLIKKGVKTNKKNKDGKTPLDMALDAQESGVIHILQKAELFKAVKLGNIPVIRKLVADGVRVDEKNKDDCTPLHLAIYDNHPEMSRVLLEELRANPTIQNNKGYTALHIAVQMNDLDTTDLILQYPYLKIDEFDKSGKTALYYAKQNSNQQLISLLKKHGATREEILISQNTAPENTPSDSDDDESTASDNGDNSSNVDNHPLSSTTFPQVPLSPEEDLLARFKKLRNNTNNSRPKSPPPNNAPSFY